MADHIEKAELRLRNYTDLPIAVGFGIKTSSYAKAVAEKTDAIVIGSAIVDLVKENLDQNHIAQPGLVTSVHRFVREIAETVSTT